MAAIELWRDLADGAVAPGIQRIAFELHPPHLVYNVPTLQRMREALGPTIGANGDPSVGYNDVLSIENEDASVSPREGVENAAAFMARLLGN